MIFRNDYVYIKKYYDNNIKTDYTTEYKIIKKYKKVSSNSPLIKYYGILYNDNHELLYTYDTINHSVEYYVEKKESWLYNLFFCNFLNC